MNKLDTLMNKIPERLRAALIAICHFFISINLPLFPSPESRWSALCAPNRFTLSLYGRVHRVLAMPLTAAATAAIAMPLPLPVLLSPDQTFEASPLDSRLEGFIG